MIKWEPAKHRLNLIEDLISKKKIVIGFDKKRGTEKTENMCHEAVTEFITKHGGPEGANQWKFGQPGRRAMDVHGKLWNAAIHAWGHPFLVQ